MLKSISHPTSLDAQRLFHGRGKAFLGYENINIDWLMPVALISLYGHVDECWLKAQAKELLKKISGCESVVVQRRYLNGAPVECLAGQDVVVYSIVENGLRYSLSLGRNQNMGLFLDMADGRQWVKEHSAGKRVLNLFAYTCAFSVAAIAGGAASVVNMDTSKASLERGRENHRLNQLSSKEVRYERVDILKSFGRIRKHGPYDLLICDPPSRQAGSFDIGTDYPKIVRRIPEFMNKGSSIMLCLNDPCLDFRFLLDMVEAECPACEFSERLFAPAVFKEENIEQGLKIAIFTYLP